MATVIKLIDSNTSELVSYEQTDVWFDGTPMDDSRADGTIYRKSGGRYFLRAPFLTNRIINATWFGAVADGVTDNIEIFSKISELLLNFSSDSTSRVIFYLPRGSRPYLTSGTLTIPRFVDVNFEGEILYSGTSAAIIVGAPGVSNARTKLKLACYSSNTTTRWDNADNIGIILYNLAECTEVFINRSDYFTEGVRFIGDGAGVVYNNINIGRLTNNQISVRLCNLNSGWVNENVFVGGRFSSTTGFNLDLTKIGIQIDSIDGNYTNNNNNNFIKPSFELKSGTGAAENIPIYIKNGSQNNFVQCRNEDNNTDTKLFIRTENASKYNWVDVGYADVTTGYGSVNDIGSVPSTKITSRFLIGQNTNQLVFKTDDLLPLTTDYNQTGLTFINSPLFFLTSTTSTLSRYVTLITVVNGFLHMESTRGIGVKVNTAGVKRFLVTSVFNLPGRIGVRCYDSSGALLSNDQTYVKGDPAVPFNWNTSFGGHWTTGSDSGSKKYIYVTDDVYSIDIFFKGATGALEIKGFNIEAIDGYTNIINPFNSTNLQAIAKPTRTDYSIGTIIYNPTVVAGSSIGWMWNGTAWVDIAPPATTSINGIVKQTAAQADSTATDITGIVSDFNALLAKLRTSGQLAT